MLDLRTVLIETIENVGEPAAERVRARPVAGQGYSPNIRVSCSVKLREQHPIGTKFLIQAKLIDRNGTPYLYSRPAAPFRVLSHQEATSYMQARKAG